MNQVANDMILGTSSYQRGIRATLFMHRDRGKGYLVGQHDLPHDYELEQDYFETLTALDRNLEERGLERGETIDEEVPLRPELRRPPFERSSFDRTEGNGYEL